MSTMLLASLLTRPRISDLLPSGARLVMALRLTVLTRRRDLDPLPILEERLGCPARARQALHIVLLAGDVWPERFTMSPPCCGTMSHDEQLLGVMADHAATGDRPSFDRAAGDLLNEDARDQLWREFTRWR
jgi:hypothetical protein